MPRFLNFHFKQDKKGRGFTLLEVIAAIFVITVGVIGGMTAIQRTITLISFSFSQLTAAYLAQEGIEIVRNIRDGNWLKGSPWNDGLPQGDWEADYQTQALNDDYDGDYLNLIDIDGDGFDDFYSYSPGTQTKFKRKITIIPDGPNILRVSTEITWSERGTFQSFSAQENLYKW